MNVAEQVIEVLKNFGSRERSIGIIDHYDLAGTTAFIRSGDQFYLAFAPEMSGLKPGQLVSFRKDQCRAKDVVRVVLLVGNSFYSSTSRKWRQMEKHSERT
jgi:hypothetical protein